jgi:hypothetical protein
MSPPVFRWEPARRDVLSFARGFESEPYLIMKAGGYACQLREVTRQRRAPDRIRVPAATEKQQDAALQQRNCRDAVRQGQIPYLNNMLG